MSIGERAEWEIYARTIRNKKISVTHGIIKKPKHGMVAGRDAYLSVNEMLTLVGFNHLQRPPKNEMLPPTPSTDLTQYAQYKNGEIKFKIWIKQAYPQKCKAQI